MAIREGSLKNPGQMTQNDHEAAFAAFSGNPSKLLKSQGVEEQWGRGPFSGAGDAMQKIGEKSTTKALNDYQAYGYTPQDFASALQQAQMQAGTFNPNMVNASQSDQTRNQNQALIQALQAQASGQAPSLAQMQLQQATQQNIANTAGQIGSTRGMNPALQARLIAQQGAAQNQNMAGQAAMARVQEQQGALGNLANALQAQRAQDISMAGLGAQTGIQQQALGNQMFGTLQNALSTQNQQQLGNYWNQQQLNAQANMQNADWANKHTMGIGQGIQKSMGAGMSGMGAGMAGGAMAEGGYVEGGEINEPGDHPDNDTVPAMLSPGEIVIPRSKADDPDKAKEFIDQLMKKEKKESKAKGGYGKVLEARRHLEQAMKVLDGHKKGK